MKRDEDFIRTLLFKYEADQEWLLFIPATTDGTSDEERRERYHILLMMDEGLLSEVGRDTMRLTSSGHDLIDAIRDENIWQQTKSKAEAIGGASLEIMGELAKAFVKQKLTELTGVQL